MKNPKPAAAQVRKIRARRAAAIKQARAALRANGRGYAEALTEIRLCDQWLTAYVTGPNATR